MYICADSVVLHVIASIGTTLNVLISLSAIISVMEQRVNDLKGIGRACRTHLISKLRIFSAVVLLEYYCKADIVGALTDRLNLIETFSVLPLVHESGFGNAYDADLRFFLNSKNR